MASDTYHEPLEQLTTPTVDLHRAIRSLMEELEAVDWYQQRVDATKDPELQRILGHNRDEEIEHACMVLEWIRRRHPSFDAALRTYLFSEGEITTVEARQKAGAGVVPAGEAPQRPATTIGSLRGTPR